MSEFVISLMIGMSICRSFMPSGAINLDTIRRSLSKLAPDVEFKIGRILGRTAPAARDEYITIAVARAPAMTAGRFTMFDMSPVNLVASWKASAPSKDRVILSAKLPQI